MAAPGHAGEMQEQACPGKPAKRGVEEGLQAAPAATTWTRLRECPVVPGCELAGLPLKLSSVSMWQIWYGMPLTAMRPALLLNTCEGLRTAAYSVHHSS